MAARQYAQVAGFGILAIVLATRPAALAGQADRTDGDHGLMSFYLSTLAVYFFIDVLLAWALNLQFGWAGIPNFALIMFQAAGAYAAAVVSPGAGHRDQLL